MADAQRESARLEGVSRRSQKRRVRSVEFNENGDAFQRPKVSGNEPAVPDDLPGVGSVAP